MGARKYGRKAEGGRGAGVLAGARLGAIRNDRAGTPTRTLGDDGPYLTAFSLQPKTLPLSLLTPLPSLLSAAAIWPVWLYLFRSWAGPGSDGTGPGLLILSLAWAAWISLKDPAPPHGSRFGTAIILAVYAGAYGWLPPLARAMIGLAALGASVVEMPGVGWRHRSGLAILFILCAPAVDTLNFFLGGPLRSLSAAMATVWLQGTGLPAAMQGAALSVDGKLFLVDSPCSGINGLWVGVVIAAAAAVYYRLRPIRTVLLVSIAVILCAPANAWRMASLVYLARLAPRIGTAAGSVGHEAVGIFTFAAVALVLMTLASRLGDRTRPPRNEAVETVPAPIPTPAGRPVSSRLLLTLVCLAACAAAIAPLLQPARLPAHEAAYFPGWPSTWLAQPLHRLAAPGEDQRWADFSPGPVAWFSVPGGRQILFRWVTRPDRRLHPSEDCYRGNGYRVTPLPPTLAPADGCRGIVIWRRFRAERDGRDYEVREVIISRQGRAYSDAAWWWWQVAGPGAKDRGPWLAVTVQELVEGGRPGDSTP